MLSNIHVDRRFRLLRSGITLPELLVVVSILLLLGSLTFPVFSSARARAKASACASNLAQMHRAVLMYMADADDLFPLAKDCLDQYAPMGYSGETMRVLEAAPLLPAALHPYARSSHIFACPSDRGAGVSESAFPTPVPLRPNAFAVCGCSYEYHTALGLGRVTGTALQNVAGVNLAGDLAGHWHGAAPMAEVGDSRDEFNEKKALYRYNLVYVDGHTKSVDWSIKEHAWREN